MNHQTSTTPQFFLTAPQPCPYLPQRFERKVFTHLVGERASEINDLLTQGGFRRSQNIAYRPACETCKACVSVRVLAQDFQRSQNLERVWRRNRDLIAKEYRAEPSSEQFKLFRSYLDARHFDGGMADMSVIDYAMMIGDSHVNTRVTEYRLPHGDHEDAGKLLAVSLADVMSDGISMVYSFYDPSQEKRSLGTYLILEHIERMKRSGLPHVYLGYWVEGSRKMEYKVRFFPQEHLGMAGWLLHEPKSEMQGAGQA